MKDGDRVKMGDMTGIIVGPKVITDVVSVVLDDCPYVVQAWKVREVNLLQACEERKKQ